MMDPTPTIFAKHGNDDLARLLQEHDVAFLVVGGTAVAAHGCRDKYDVDDFDILINPTLENAQNVIDALAAASLRPSFKPEALTRPAVQLPLKILHYWAELLTPREGVDFNELVKRSIIAQISDLSVQVIGRADLIAIKQVAAPRIGTEHSKHQKDLVCLKSK